MGLTRVEKLKIDRKMNKNYTDTIHRNLIKIIYNKNLIQNDNILKYLLDKKELLKSK